MKKHFHPLTILYLVAAMVLVASQNKTSDFNGQPQPKAEAGMPVFFSWGGEKITQVADFPDVEELKNTSLDKFIDAGVRFKQVTVFFIPVWNYEVTWCGYVDSDEQYINLSYEDLAGIAEEVHIPLPTDPEKAISPWNRYGGKLVLGGLFVLYALYSGSAAKANS